MSIENRNMEDLLAVAGLNTEPDPQHMQAVEAHVLKLARAARPRHTTRRAVGLGALLLAGAATAGLAGTQAGRDWVRHLVVSVRPASPPPIIYWGTTADGERVGYSSESPMSPEEVARRTADSVEIRELAKAGAGRLLFICPTYSHVALTSGLKTEYSVQIEYTCHDGRKYPIYVMPEFLTPLQKTKMRVDEILRLYDSGAGQIVSYQPRPEPALPAYTTRFTLADGDVVDVESIYPPTSPEERAKIFAETRQLRAAGRFKVADAVRSKSGQVTGLFHYTLADGRQMEISEDLPPDLIAPDGKSVIATETGQGPQPGQ